jgi:hypothetical protein
MNGTIRPAQRTNAKPLIGIYAESGKGKTYSSLLLARGFVGPKGSILMIETESGRGEAFSDKDEYPEIGGYDVLPLRDDFSPQAYGAALTDAEKHAPGALIIDSASHEWEGAGGVLAMAADAQAGGKKGPIVWQKPKMDHQRHFMLRLMQTPIALVIVCMRAKYPMKEIKQANGRKEWSRSDELHPKQSEDILYEMLAHGWLDDDHRFRSTKMTTRALESVLVDNERITVDTGKRLAVMAAGTKPPAAKKKAPPKEEPGPELEDTDVPTEFLWTSGSGQVSRFDSVGTWVSKVTTAMGKCTKVEQIELSRRNNGAHLAEVAGHGGDYAEAVARIEEAFAAETRRIGA